MSIAVNSIPSIVSTQGIAGEVAFQPGSTVSARVLQVLPDNQARISIAGQSIDVKTQVPLQAGQTLQLAVSQTADGIRLAVMPRQAAASAAVAASSSDLSATLMTTLAASKVQLTAPEAIAVSQAALGAVTKQASLATLFANLGAATSLQNLPPKLQQAVAQVLAQRPPLDAQLTGDEVKSAFQKSGLFLEASLAKAMPTSGAVPDMKAALVVLKQALATTLAADTGRASTVSIGTTQTAPAQPQQAASQPVAIPTTAATAAQTQAAAATLVPAMLPKSTSKGDAVQTGASAPADEGADIDLRPQPAAPAARLASVVSGGGTQQQANTKAAEIIAQLLSDDGAPLEALATVRTQAAPLGDTQLLRPQAPPPPPLRGALPTAQPVAQATLAPDTPLDDTVRHLMADTDAAIARQTLHQVASLPDRGDAAMAQRADQHAPRWSFEIPFAMPHGTAVAQFEISRDGSHGTAAEEGKRIWSARFSLDIEPAGPVHAQVSLAGDKTSVRMWAERPATAQQLEAGAGQLSQALIRANLQPGDIVIRKGAPEQALPASAGHFLDLAL